MSTIHLPQQRPASGPASATAAPAGEPGWSRVLLVAGSRAALAVVLSLVVWSVLPAALGWSPRVIMSGSMEPRIHVGDIVVDRPVDPATLTEGRIITVTDPDHPEKTRTHRLQEWNDSGQIVTKGDANDAADSTPVDPGDVLGVAAIRVPFVGLPVTWLAQGQLAPVGITVTLLVLLGLAATTPLRLSSPTAGADDEQSDSDDSDDTDRPDDTDGDAGLGILDPAAAARRRDRTRSEAPRRGGRVATRSALPGRRARRLGVAGAVLGAVLATFATTGTTYAAFSAPTANPSSAFSTAASFTPYRDEVLSDGPSLYWRLDETSGSIVSDSSGRNATATVRGTYDWTTAGALVSEPASSALGLAGAYVTQNASTTMGSQFSSEAWIRTTSTSGGMILGFGSTGGTSYAAAEDRVLYLSPDGRIRFGIGSTRTAIATGVVNDGEWHHVVATYTTGANGMKLYLDGVLQSQGRANLAVNTGFWRAGVENLSGWPSTPGSAFLIGDVDELAVYNSRVLTGAEIAAHYATSQNN